MINCSTSFYNEPHYLIWIFSALWVFNFSFFNTSVWLDGSANYLWPMFFQLFFILMYVDSIRNHTWKFLQGEGIGAKLPAFILGLLAGNTNENSALAIAIAAAILYWKKRSSWMKYGLLGIVIGYAVLIFAPGNYVRYQTVLTAGNIMGPLSRPHSKILRVSEENLFYAAKRLKYSLSGTSYPSAS
ncbi:MAG: hypothetical protein ACFWTM_07695 [Mitsuokella multacida]